MQKSLAYVHYPQNITLAALPVILPCGINKDQIPDYGDIRSTLKTYFLSTLSIEGTDQLNATGRIPRYLDPESICAGFARLGEEVTKALTAGLKNRLKAAEVPLGDGYLAREQQLTPGNIHASTIMKLFWMEVVNKYGQGSFYDRAAS